MIVRFPDGTPREVSTQPLSMAPDSGGGTPKLVFTNLYSGAPDFSFTCFSVQEQSDLQTRINDALRQGKPFLDLVSIAPIPTSAIALTMTLAPGTAGATTATSPAALSISKDGYESVLLELPYAGSPGSPPNAFAKDGLVWFDTNLCPMITYQNASAILVVTPVHVAATVGIRYQDSRGTTTWANVITYA